MSIVIPEHCMEPVPAAHAEGDRLTQGHETLAAELRTRRLLCRGASGVGQLKRIAFQPDGSARFVPGAPNVWHRSGSD